MSIVGEENNRFYFHSSFGNIPIEFSQNCINFESKKQHLSYCTHCHYYYFCKFSYFFVDCKEFSRYSAQNPSTLHIDCTCDNCVIKYVCPKSLYYDTFDHRGSMIEPSNILEMINTNAILAIELEKGSQIRGQNVNDILRKNSEEIRQKEKEKEAALAEEKRSLQAQLKQQERHAEETKWMSKLPPGLYHQYIQREMRRILAGHVMGANFDDYNY